MIGLEVIGNAEDVELHNLKVEHIHLAKRNISYSDALVSVSLRILPNTSVSKQMLYESCPGGDCIFARSSDTFQMIR